MSKSAISLSRVNKLFRETALREYGHDPFFRWNFIRECVKEAEQKNLVLCARRASKKEFQASCDNLIFYEDPEHQHCGWNKTANFPCYFYRLSDAFSWAVEDKVFIPHEDDWGSYSLAREEKPNRRVNRELSVLLRGASPVVALKRLYDNRCCVCDMQLRVTENEFYSEVHHLRPLGEPHNGPDDVSNMMVLCPNHHILFDRGAVRWEDKNSISIGVQKFSLQLRHHLDEENVLYYQQQVQKNQLESEFKLIG